MRQLPRSYTNPVPVNAIFGAAAIVALSFYVTLVLTDPGEPDVTGSIAPRIERLRGAAVSDESGVYAAAQAAGLRASADMQGVIDALTRRPDGRVSATGWAVRRGGDGRPLTMLAFSGGPGVVIGATQGVRDDVTRALGLSATAARNVRFEAVLDCQPRQPVLLVAVSEDGRYSPLPAATCP